MLSRVWNRVRVFFGCSPSSPKTKEQLQIEVRDLMYQMARTQELDECCRFLSVLLLAYTFETTKESYYNIVDGRGEVAVKIDKRWGWHEPVSGVKICHWEEHCFGEKGEEDTWLL